MSSFKIVEGAEAAAEVQLYKCTFGNCTFEGAAYDMRTLRLRLPSPENGLEGFDVKKFAAENALCRTHAFKVAGGKEGVFTLPSSFKKLQEIKDELLETARLRKKYGLNGGSFGDYADQSNGRRLSETASADARVRREKVEKAERRRRNEEAKKAAVGAS